MTKCQEVEASCFCHLEEGHDGPHKCDCGGSWDRKDGKFYLYEFPGLPGLLGEEDD